MSRRRFVHGAAAGTLASVLFSNRSSAAQAVAASYHPARVVSASQIPLPAGKREPFGWKTAAVGAVPLVLDWPDLSSSIKPSALRLTVGLDIGDEKLVEAVLPESGRLLASPHSSKFIINDGLVYENHVSAISDGTIYGIEGPLPFATLAHLEPKSPLIDLVVKFCLGRRKENGAILDGHHSSSEGCYTVGYPLAVIGKLRQDEELQKLALAQLRVRQPLLFDGETFWRTSDPTADGGVKRGNRNWARGVAWQFLGYARVLRELKHRDDIADLIEDFRKLAVWIQPFQRKDGLWAVFVDEPGLPADTAGSAGIAAALAIGAQQGWLDAKAKSSAARTLEGLKPHLTPDGFLGGVSQSNKVGEGLQRGDYRVIYQMGMGLMAQLIAALEAK